MRETNFPKYAIFCDFDGTITAEDTFTGMLKAVAPHLCDEYLPDIYAQKLTLREGVKRIIESIPSQSYSQMIDYVDEIPLRPGFVELVKFAISHHIPFHVVSGGLKDMVKRVLTQQTLGNRPLLEQVASINAVAIDTSNDYLRAISDYEGGTELVAKVEVMKQYPAQNSISIGDSITDLNIALNANISFARDRLARYLDAADHFYYPWDDFFTVQEKLMTLIEIE
ncbi:HAD-superfamily hydrolase, subfamily IB (PSPase-like) [Halothece sp. PCC 7418]|uniref:HAD-IB family phosphatase n=1 Tax=Halothece sp. (strain PCC 7418) TaxID=65093 RepID=UPI0002A063CE|nr:HAD-IB family phosphatase [Halothece sp. PCC 7418]AFZ45728.1 HAD-superfamily hydrolase, subfamily IB (PSPase-like) [Halothece sp. PCC 7418]